MLSRRPAPFFRERSPPHLGHSPLKEIRVIRCRHFRAPRRIPSPRDPAAQGAWGSSIPRRGARTRPPAMKPAALTPLHLPLLRMTRASRLPGGNPKRVREPLMVTALGVPGEEDSMVLLRPGLQSWIPDESRCSESDPQAMRNPGSALRDGIGRGRILWPFIG